MLLRRSVVVALVVATAVTATRLAGPTQASHARVSRALACGTERWIVKTLQDRPRLIRAQTTSVAHLVGLVRPRPAAAKPSRHILIAEPTAVGSNSGTETAVAATRSTGS